MWGDVVDLATLDWVGRTALILFALLPLISLVLVVRGFRLAWIPIGITAGLTLVWFLHYATDWWEPVGAAAGLGIFGLALGAGWAIVVRQLWRARHETRGERWLSRERRRNR